MKLEENSKFLGLVASLIFEAEIALSTMSCELFSFTFMIAVGIVMEGDSVGTVTWDSVLKRAGEELQGPMQRN